MFDNLSDRLNKVFKDLRGHGKLSEKNIEDALREVRMALLEADVNFKVVKDFVATVTEKPLARKCFPAFLQVNRLSKLFMPS